MGSVSVTMTGITGCATAATKLIVTARNLPSSVWLQNATCTATANQAQITLVTARTDVGDLGGGGDPVPLDRHSVAQTHR